MPEGVVILRARKFMINKLLARKQMILDVIHPGKPNVSKSELTNLIGKKFKADPRNVVVYGLKTKFGGGKSTGMCLIYESQQYLLKYEPKYRLRRTNVLPEKIPSRKSGKELKGKTKKVRGKERAKLLLTSKQEKPNAIKKLKEDYLKKFIAK